MATCVIAYPNVALEMNMTNARRKYHVDPRIILCLLILFMIPSTLEAYAWSNGGYSANPSIPDYGTHDWIAEHALDWLPQVEKQYIVNNLAIYKYGTELPDSNQAPDGINDQYNHHVYYRSSGLLQDGASAVRASSEYSSTLSYLKANNLASAAKHAGIMSHYIVDVTVFGHVMGASTDWGTEVHHTTDYEPYVNDQTSSYGGAFSIYLSFDGKLDVIPAYNATLRLAYDTTFGGASGLTCVWMDGHYSWSNPTFKNRCGESLNLATNYLADVLQVLLSCRLIKSPVNSRHIRVL